MSGLFGLMSHEINVRSDEPTILTGPNGSGKTHVLTLLRASLALDVRTLLNMDFDELRVTFESGDALQVKRLREDDSPSVVFQALTDDAPVGNPLVAGADLLERGPYFPANVREVGKERWLERRTGHLMTRKAAERRFGASHHLLPRELLGRSPEVVALCSPPLPVFIDTKRLDVAEAARPDFESEQDSTAVSRINEYLERLRLEVTEARRASITATQRADVSFAARALAAAKLSVKESALHKRYDETVDRFETLAKNALAVGEAPLDFPADTNPTVRRILSVFLDDWDERLAPLLPLNQKLQTLRDIIDSKLRKTGKATVMSPRGAMEFRSYGGNRIRVNSLSSGEQHLVALFTSLVFSAAPGSLVLIDEPEISLHAAWKHAFLDDISRVAELNGLQVVLATHSTGIINGRWDLTETLSLPDLSDDETEHVGVEEEADEVDELN